MLRSRALFVDVGRLFVVVRVMREKKVASAVATVDGWLPGYSQGSRVLAGTARYCTMQIPTTCENCEQRNCLSRRIPQSCLPACLPSLRLQAYLFATKVEGTRSWPAARGLKAASVE